MEEFSSMDYSSLRSPSSSRTSSRPSRASSNPSTASSNPSRASTQPPPLPVSSPPAYNTSNSQDHIVDEIEDIEFSVEDPVVPEAMVSSEDRPPRLVEVDDSKVPTLPSVRELATKFMPKYSPEPKPRKSLTKVRI